MSFLHVISHMNIRRAIAQTHLIVAVTAGTMLAGCMVAPGMKMENQATIAETTATSTTPATKRTVPVTEIDLSLIKVMRDEVSREAERQIQPLIGKSGAYTIGPGDVLLITLWDHPEIAAAVGSQSQANNRQADPIQGFLVESDGYVQYPFAGRIKVGGLTAEQAQGRLRDRLNKTFVDPQVTVRVASFRSKEIYLDGEVHAPGTVQVNDIPMTLSSAINRAGGFTTTADQGRLVLVRNGVSYDLNFPQLLQYGPNPGSIELKGGDLLHVASRDANGVFVMGEVNKPLTAIPEWDGTLTLSQAIAQAGSFNSSSADASQVFVIRGSTTSTPQIFHLNARSPVSMVLANQFELQPKDIVYVDGNGLVRFSRVLSLLLPGINAGITAAYLSR